MSFPFYRQYDAMDCGPTCLRMIAKYYGKELSISTLREASGIRRDGVSLLGISEAAEKIGFKTIANRISFEQLDEDALLPCILHWQQNHFIVLPPQNYNRRRKHGKILIADPAVGLIRIERQAFLESWLANGREGLILQLQTTPAFHSEGASPPALSWDTMMFYLRTHRRYFTQVGIGLLAGSLLQLLFPFLTQSIVDTGIQTHNLQFIYIILAGQAMLFFARTTIEFIRSRLLLFISTRINISLLTGFWHKLMRLPVSYFDTRLTGDIQQRLLDQQQVESFLTGSSLTVLFSLINLLVFSIVLLIYSLPVAIIFSIGSVLYFLWVRHFLARRRDLNYQRFTIAAKEQGATLQIIQGIQEIKLLNSERHFRWEWEHIQARLFRLQVKSLSLSQMQWAGALAINEGKNILITCFVASLVIKGELTLGAMLAIQYIIGQLNSPVEQLVLFTQHYQDARIALERLDEIQGVADEEPVQRAYCTDLPADRSISIMGLNFTYRGAGATPALHDINLVIPQRKLTAIVGASGSGKTTLLKLLLKIYETYDGSIIVGRAHMPTMPAGGFAGIGGTVSHNGFHRQEVQGINLKEFSPSFWRGRCGSVRQDGFVFEDSILRNIAVGEEHVDMQWLLEACQIAHILPFIQSLPLGFDTHIGAEGNGISQGQRQRILIARAIYRDPEYLFFDEATNALDANNECGIMNSLNSFFKGRTVVVVAHRLSTVMRADNIVVLDGGRIVEQGTHGQLIKCNGCYYELVKNQLALSV